MYTEIHRCARFGLIKYEVITGYFKDFLSQRLCAYEFPNLGFDNFPISFHKFYRIIPIVLQKFGLTMKKLSEAVQIFLIELRFQHKRIGFYPEFNEIVGVHLEL